MTILTSTREQRTVLVLGTLHGQAEAIRHLRAIGWTVYSCGHRRDGPGVTNADDFFLVDILDVDAVSALAERLAVDIVYSVGSDIAMPTVAAVSERLGLANFHSIELIEILHRKVNLRTFLDLHGISPVDHSTVCDPDDLARFSTYPAIVKPSDSQGQRGITIVADRGEAEAAIGEAIAASHTATAIIEELLDGPEVSVHVFVVDGVVRFFLPSDRIVWDGPMVGVPAAHTIPASFLTSDDVEQVRMLVDRTVESLPVVNGPLYFQLKMTARGPRIIEIAPRLDGCHLWRLIEITTGFDLLDRCFRLLGGSEWEDVSTEIHTPARLDFMLSEPTASFDPANWPAPADPVLYEEFQVEPGSTPRAVNPVVARIGYRIVSIS